MHFFPLQHVFHGYPASEKILWKHCSSTNFCKNTSLFVLARVSLVEVSRSLLIWFSWPDKPCFCLFRLIKMSSPHINNIIIVGCIICYITVILLGVDTQLVDNNKLPQFCNVRMAKLVSRCMLLFEMFFPLWHEIRSIQLTILRQSECYPYEQIWNCPVLPTYHGIIIIIIIYYPHYVFYIKIVKSFKIYRTTKNKLTIWKLINCMLSVS